MIDPISIVSFVLLAGLGFGSIILTKERMCWERDL